MKRKYIQLILIAAMLVGVFAPSCRFLDIDDNFNDEMKEDSIYTNKLNLEKYMWGTAAFFPEEGSIFGSNYTPGPLATDEGITLFGTGEFRGMAFILGEVTPDNLYGMNIWGNMYKIIRKANNIFARMNEAKDMTTIDRQFFLGYTHFLRGYAYYHLLMQYGPFIIMGDEVLENNESTQYYARPRNTYDECVEYVCNELELAAKFLPVDVPVNNFGRPTRGAALGLVARIRLQAASPLFNGQQAARTYFGSWLRKSDGIPYVSQTYDEQKWALAALAAKRIIDMNKYSLHTVERMGDTPKLPANVSSADFPEGAGNLDPFRSYSYMFNGESLPQRNPEFVWGRMSNSVTNYTRHSFPKAGMGGWNGLSVTQKIVDAYLMADGRTINNSSPDYPYSEDEFLGGADRKFSGYLLKNSVNKMYVNREMRFYASIGFSEGYWSANSTTDNTKKNIVVTYYYDGLGGKASAGENPLDYPITGYVLRKYIHEDDAWDGNAAQRIPKPFPIIRYAEIILSYVEALNSLTTTYQFTDEDGTSHSIARNINEIKHYFNQVRYRAGLPGITDAEAADPATVQRLLERERMVEFLFENRRFYDVRRWGIYEDTERQLMQGMDTDAYKDTYYKRVALNHSKARSRIIDRKLVFLPIARGELRRAPLLDQNPGWDD